MLWWPLLCWWGARGAAFCDQGPQYRTGREYGWTVSRISGIWEPERSNGDLFPWSEEGLGFEYSVLVVYELRLAAALPENLNDGSWKASHFCLGAYHRLLQVWVGWGLMWGTLTLPDSMAGSGGPGLEAGGVTHLFFPFHTCHCPTSGKASRVSVLWPFFFLKKKHNMKDFRNHWRICIWESLKITNSSNYSCFLPFFRPRWYNTFERSTQSTPSSPTPFTHLWPQLWSVQRQLSWQPTVPLERPWW